MSRRLSLVFLFFPAVAYGQAELPIASGVPWEPLREQCRRLNGNPGGRAFVPPETAKALHALLDKEPADDDGASAVQKLLDPHCLVAVTINPESRVKAARGPVDLKLIKDKATLVLVKVNNEAGVTHALAVSGPQLIGKGGRGEGRWLEVQVLSMQPLAPGLLGQRLEYVVLQLKPREAGKREATLKFDVGQGSQDLGFRGEVPILFTVREP